MSNQHTNSLRKLNTDFLIIGAGILGLSFAKALHQRYPNKNIIVLEKENAIGLHASGRNSGVLHSGIYYAKDSLKAKLCANGAKAMANYCHEHNLDIANTGKVIVPIRETDSTVLEMLYDRAQHNGAQVELIDAKQLKEIEPETHSATGKALFSPQTSVVDSKQILQHLSDQLMQQGVTILKNSECHTVESTKQQITAGNAQISYGHLFNTAGLYADKIAHQCGLEHRYTMIPFKGYYYELTAKSNIKINHLIYPVPDMNVPFLGVHFTRGINNKIYVGPTAVPALGREHYKGLAGLNPLEASKMSFYLLRQYIDNQQGFRKYAHNEAGRFLKSKFTQAAKALVPNLTKADLIQSKKIGIRAQLLDLETRQLVMDFLVEKTKNETHILNAVSPAFTSAFSFVDHVLEDF